MKLFVSFVLLLLFMAAGIPRVHASIWINEFSSENGTDWVEIYNDSESEVVPLSAYQLKDNSSSGNLLPLTGLLAPKGFVTFDWGSSLNKNGDVIALIDTVKNETVDRISYGDVEGSVIAAPSSGQYGGRITDGHQDVSLFSTHSKGSTNSTVSQVPTATLMPSATPKPTTTPTRTPTPTKLPTPTKTPTSLPGKPSATTTMHMTGGSPRRTDPSPTVDRNIPTAVLAAKSARVWPTVAPSTITQEVKTAGVAAFNYSYVFIGVGILLIGGCGIVVYLKHKHAQKENSL